MVDAPAAKQGHFSNGGWRGNKNSPLEGGHRVPFFAVWPKKIRPGISHELVVNQDLLATLASLVGTKVPAGQAMDSNNLLPLLTGNGTFRRRRAFIQQAGSRHEVMIRKMPWKLIMQSDPKRSRFEAKMLFNLVEDPHEDHNLLEEERYAEMTAQLRREYLSVVTSGRSTVIEPSRESQEESGDPSPHLEEKR
ncbi:MAG: sulfatase/phosphatase domain-containing protein [Planctomycetota bacterium]